MNLPHGFIWNMVRKFKHFLKIVKRKSCENSAIVSLLKSVLRTQIFNTTFACELIDLGQFRVASFSLAKNHFFLILAVVPLTLCGLMDLKIFILRQMRIHLEQFITKWTSEHFLVLFVVLWTVMRLNWVMLSAKCFWTVFTVDRQPVLLTADWNGAELSNFIVFHFDFLMSQDKIW